MAEWPEKNRPGFVLFFEDTRPEGFGLGMPEDQSYHDLPEIKALMNGVLNHPGNHLGLIDQFDETLQFYVNGDGSVLIDFIVRDKSGSLQAILSLKECIALVQSSVPSLSALQIPNAEFNKW